MSSVICPCVTAQDPHAYREQMARIAPFAERIHVDFSDGILAPVRLINPIQAFWPEHVLPGFRPEGCRWRCAGSPA